MPDNKSRYRVVCPRCKGAGTFELNYAKSIASRRAELGMTQAELAEETGLHRTSITNIELGNQAATVEALFMIGQVLGLSLDEMFKQPK